MHLAELQRAFQNHVLHEGGPITQVIRSSTEFPAEARLGIYADAYRLRLVDALAYNYPRLQQQLGAAAFDLLGRRYLAAQPSKRSSVRWFGDRLADYLAQDAQYSDQPWLAELACWEWTLAAAFDAPDARALTSESLGGIDTIDWPSLRFRFHPSLHAVRLQTNAPTLGRESPDGEPADPPAVLDVAQAWLIWRQDLVTRYRLLGEDEAEALATMSGLTVPGEPGTFEEMCDTLCRFHDSEDVPLRAAAMLKTWVSQGLVVEVLVETAQEDSTTAS